MKRVFSILISLCAIVSAYADGDVIEIWTKEQLVELRDKVNAGKDTYTGKTVKLMADLNLGTDADPINWEPIGSVDNEDKVFKGTFDGQGYTITMYASDERVVTGLFGYLYGTVQHLKVAGRIINSLASTNSSGGIAAYNKETISQCANLATIIGTTAGGIAGENHGTITNCYNRGNIRATGGFSTCYLGGIAGANDNATISCTYASCTIDDTNKEGGITGNNINSGTVSKSSYDVLLDNGSSTSAMDGSATLTGNALESDLGNSIWVFTAEELPELTCFKNKIVRLSDNNDNSAILTSYHEQTCNVELNGRTLYKDGDWNTLCLPFNLTLSGSALDGDGVVAKVLNSAGTSLNSEGLLTLVFDNAPATILAGTPFIIKWNNTGVHLSNVQFNNVKINKTAPTPVKFSTVCQFVGTYSPFSIGDTSKGTYDGDINEIILLSSDNTLGYSKNPRTLRSCRAHFMIPTPPSGIRAMVDFDIDFNGGESTGIAALNDNGEMIHDNDGWYTLTGVKLDGKPTRRGIYLHNGRKEAVR